MNKIKKSIGLFIIASAIIWGAVIIACSMKLKGTGCFDEISYILSAGAGIHLLLIWGPLTIQLRKIKKEEGEEEDV
ncbi:MAG: hypothetical protein PVH61_24310 [Candidatus Aminicenantes bacterium]|jgi:hypothetical protein